MSTPLTVIERPPVPAALHIGLHAAGNDGGVLPLEVRWSGETGEIVLPRPACDGDVLRLDFRVDLHDIHGMWEPSANRPVMELAWHCRRESACHLSLPFICFVNRYMSNKAAFGLLDPVPDTVIEAGMSQGDHAYKVSITRALEPGTTGQMLFSSGSRLPWQEVFSRYRDLVIVDEAPAAVPAAAREPVYCTWYAMHGAPDQHRVLHTAERAASLGFATYIIDDGWQFDEARSLKGDISNWYRHCGDWEVSGVKFPDFRETVDRLHRMGLKCLLWLAPTMVGIDSRACSLHENDLLSDQTEGYRHLTMCSPIQRERLCRLSAKLISDYNLDGLKIDFLSEVELRNRRRENGGDDCRTAGEGMRRFMRELRQAVRHAAPGSLLEYRQRYATVATRPYATQFRAGDVPYDFVGNRSRCVNVRLNTGPGAVPHADPAYWSPGESVENVALHMLSMMFAVPMLSLDFDLYPSNHLDIIRHYLAVYREIAGTVIDGVFSAANDASGNWSVLQAGDEKRRVIGLFGRPVQPPDLGLAPETVIFNGSTDSFAGRWLSPCRGKIEVCDPCGRVVFNCSGTENLEIPVGGMARLCR